MAHTYRIVLYKIEGAFASEQQVVQDIIEFEREKEATSIFQCMRELEVSQEQLDAEDMDTAINYPVPFLNDVLAHLRAARGRKEFTSYVTYSARATVRRCQSQIQEEQNQ